MIGVYTGASWRVVPPMAVVSIRHGQGEAVLVELAGASWLDDLHCLVRPMMRGELHIVVRAKFSDANDYWSYHQDPARDRKQARIAKIEADLKTAQAACKEESAWIEAASRLPLNHFPTKEVEEHMLRYHAAVGLVTKLRNQLARAYR